MIRTVDFRYYAVRNGANFCELKVPDDSEANITMDDSGSIKTKLSGSFLPPAEDVNWLTDEIRPVLIINGVEHRLGLFLAANVKMSVDGTSSRLIIDSYDRGWIVRDHRTEYTLYFPAGTKYIDAVGSILAESGITLISATACDEVLAEDRADWDIGTSSLDIVNQLLAEINYEELWFDQDGVAILEPKATPTANNIDHVLDESIVESMMLPGLSTATDVYEQPNVFVCVCSNADKSTAMRAVAENTNPQSPLSIARRGRRITSFVTVDNIATQAELQLYADRMVTDSLLKGETFGLSTCLLPGYGVGDIVVLRYGDIYSLCKERRWTMELRPGGLMSHTLERVVMNLD